VCLPPSFSPSPLLTSLQLSLGKTDWGRCPPHSSSSPLLLGLLRRQHQMRTFGSLELRHCCWLSVGSQRLLHHSARLCGPWWRFQQLLLQPRMVELLRMPRVILLLLWRLWLLGQGVKKKCRSGGLLQSPEQLLLGRLWLLAWGRHLPLPLLWEW
jgi:hypothetical protein